MSVEPEHQAGRPRAGRLEVRGLSVHHPGQAAPALRGVSLTVEPGTIHAVIGPSGSGKSSLLRSLNLMSVEFDGARLSGSVRLDGEEIVGAALDVARLRRRLGLVLSAPHLLPRSIRGNLVYGPRLAGVRGRVDLEERVEESLRAAQLWEEVKDRLDGSPRSLSGGQQQRLCLARALALRPDVLLLDEPCAGLDPISTLRIEETLRAQRERTTFVLSTSNTRQAARVGDRVAFLLLGEVVEDAPATQLFTAPRDPRTNAYLSGRIG